MYKSILTPVLLVLSVLYTTAFAGAAEFAPGPVLAVRQQQAASPECLEYARTANLSTVGSNSTLRATFLQLSSVGTLYDARMFAEAIGKLPAMTANAGLNQQCGNFTEIALVEANVNYTDKAIVLQFSQVHKDAQAIKAGPDLIAIVLFIIMILFGVWSFMP